MVQLTSGEAGLLVTLGELHVEIGDQGVDVVIPLDLQAERRGERQVVGLHRVDVHLLRAQSRFLNPPCLKNKRNFALVLPFSFINETVKGKHTSAGQRPGF